MGKSKVLNIFFAAILTVGSFVSSASGCYAVVVGKDASTDGAVLLGHNEQNYGPRFLNFSEFSKSTPHRTYNWRGDKASWGS